MEAYANSDFHYHIETISTTYEVFGLQSFA